jgi:hypothetical protein
VAQDGFERLKEGTAHLKETTTGLVEGVKERIPSREEAHPSEPTPLSEGDDRLYEGERGQVP